MGNWITHRKALLLDLDNTLYDWVSYFGPALRGMCRALSEMSGLSSNVLFDELKTVFKRHGTVEYSFAIQELPSLRAKHPEDTQADLVDRYRPVIEVFQQRRRSYLRTYPGVRNGIELLHEAGYHVFGVTDSLQFQVENRLRQLRLDRLLDGLCCVPNHQVPGPETIASIRRKSADNYGSDLRSVITLPEGLRKPAPGVLDFVVSSLKVNYDSCIYVGDSLAKDVAMAQLAGVYDCWAEYGTRVSPLDLATLVRVTDWPPRAVKAALQPSPEKLRIYPSYAAWSFDKVVSLALMEPDERPKRRTMKEAPRQVSLLEVVPAFSSTGN